MTLTDPLYSIIAILLGAMGYFIKRILDNTEKIGADVSDMKPKVKVLWEREFATATSPLVLNGRGKQLLDSGIKAIVDANGEELIKQLTERNPQNAYEVQECSYKVIRILLENKDIVAQLQDIAFKNGVNVDALLFIGAIYLRDLALPRYDFKLEDIDFQEPKKKISF